MDLSARRGVDLMLRMEADRNYRLIALRRHVIGDSSMPAVPSGITTTKRP